MKGRKDINVTTNPNCTHLYMIDGVCVCLFVRQNIFWIGQKGLCGVRRAPVPAKGGHPCHVPADMLVILIILILLINLMILKLQI